MCACPSRPNDGATAERRFSRRSAEPKMRAMKRLHPPSSEPMARTDRLAFQETARTLLTPGETDPDSLLTMIVLVYGLSPIRAGAHAISMIRQLMAPILARALSRSMKFAAEQFE